MIDRDPDFSGGENDAAFARGIAGPLRAPERPGPGFDARVMAGVRAEAGRPRQPVWWRRRLVLQISPLSGLATAAGFAALVALGTLGAAGALGRPAAFPASAPAVQPTQLVRFAVRAPGAGQVSVVGDFNGWTREATLLSASTADGLWTITLRLPPGRHEYAFIIDGQQWVIDPLAATVTDDFGTETSVIRVGASES